MKPKATPPSNQSDFFGHQLKNIIDLSHPIVRLCHRIDWSVVEKAWGERFRSHRGRPALSTRLMAGLMLMQHTEGLSDGDTVKLWLRDPYWQYFCGMDYFQHKIPIHPSSMVRWRKYIGESGAKKLLGLTVDTAIEQKVISTEEVKQVNVDTSVQEKAITYPTDSKLYLKALLWLAKMAKRKGIKLRQSYTRTAKLHALKAGRYAHAKQYKRMRRELKALRTKLGRVMRDMERKSGSIDCPKLERLLTLAKRLYAQQPKDTNKLYALHAPEVACISKGKAHKRYEFGTKVGIATTNKQGFVVGIETFLGNPYDGHTFANTLKATEEVTGKKIKRAFVDKGYKGCAYKDVDIYRSGQRGLSQWYKKRLHARSHIEATIGHMKNEGKLGKNWLKGMEGDKINAIVCGVGQNMRLLLNALAQIPLVSYFWRNLRQLWVNIRLLNKQNQQAIA